MGTGARRTPKTDAQCKEACRQRIKLAAGLLTETESLSLSVRESTYWVACLRPPQQMWPPREAGAVSALLKAQAGPNSNPCPKQWWAPGVISLNSAMIEHCVSPFSRPLNSASKTPKQNVALPRLRQHC